MKKVILFSILLICLISKSQIVAYQFYGDLIEYPDSCFPIVYIKDNAMNKKLINFCRDDSLVFGNDIVFETLKKSSWKNTFPSSVVGVNSVGLSSAYNSSLFTPSSRTVTVNGVSYDLSSNRSWAVGDIYTSGSYSNPSWLTSLAQSKITYSGSNTQYIKGDGTFGKMPEKFTGTTNGSGEYAITFSSSYSVSPNIQVAIQGDHPSYTAVVSSKSTTGCTIKVYTLSSILALGLVPQYSAVSGVVVDVIVTEK